jgi:Exostosin family
MFSVFSDRSYLPQGAPHHVLFFPFWGKHSEDARDPNAGRFDRYTALGGHFLQLTALSDADVAVLPADWSSVMGDDEAIERAVDFVALALRAGKRTAVFFANDSTAPVSLDGVTVLRTSLRRSARRSSEFAQPAWSEDFVARHLDGRIPLTRKRERPVVGFCGLVAPSRLHMPVTIPLRRQERLRARALDVLEKAKPIATNFVRRDRFLGGALSGGTLDTELLWSSRREYVQNMVESDYVLCVRGAGNFSYRLYETLSCGRIPVFVDTDCVLPFDFLVEWRDYCVWVDEREVDLIADRVSSFHENLNDKDFVELQRECRRVWEEFVSPLGFFGNFHRHFLDTARHGADEGSEITT